MSMPETIATHRVVVLDDREFQVGGSLVHAWEEARYVSTPYGVDILATLDDLGRIIPAAEVWAPT